MANIKFMLLTLSVTITVITALPRPEIEVITQPKPGDEYVFVQTSSSGARPISRKDKHNDQERQFETAHKLPPSLTYALNHENDDDEIPETKSKSKVHKREAQPGESPAPAPAGAIKLDVQKLLQKYKTELKTSTTSTTAAPKRTTKAASRRRPGNKRVKKEAKEGVEVTSPRSVLTTGAPSKKIDIEDIPLVASGSEKQKSRIQIKKGPNGQEYEYEYVYYYYDDDDDDKKDPKKDAKKVSNSHDGPARNQITQAPSRSRGSVEKTSAAPEVNEVLPAAQSRSRGRQLGEDEIAEERLPANTRFPPRSRNLNTTPLPEEEPKTTRGRGRGRPTTEAAPSAVVTEADSVSDETQGSRGRTRANVRRPSLELVDNASFNTHSNTAGAEPSSGSPSFPADLPAGPVRFLGATPNESVDPPEPIVEPKKEAATTVTEETGTTVMSPMDKVALDLYAILQGTQKLSGEETESSSEEISTDETEVTTLEVTTEAIVETTTPTTTTTTTTTTTPAPTTTTTTTTEAPTGRGRFKGRGRKTTNTASTTETAQTEAKPKSKFSRPSFGRPRPGGRTTPEPAVEEEAVKEESKPVSHSRPTLSRSRFGASRTRARTTAAPSEETNEDTSSSTAAPSRPSFTRPRSSFNLRTRGRTTAAPSEDGEAANEEAASSSEATISTTTRSRRVQAGSAVRPLRPGPRINLRGRPGQTTTTTEESIEDHVTGDEENTSSNSSTNTSENAEEKDADTSAAPVDNSPLGRLRNKNRVNVQARPKAAASAPVQVRRVNPLLARRKPGQSTEATSSEAAPEASTEPAPVEEESEDQEASSSSTTTTEEPRGLNRLLAGRRRLGTRTAAHQ